ncbi:MAG: dTDP-glucose 4,6-dehydratase [Gemmatimonadaceae bacterium]|nr:dTDP-glucose 4,6-dehydratase [Gemmatimonadaceae bacterium]NUR33016.1 dTDP-glucose 4,6-dehydratase [Gemmatimonadaceae bacterium]
MTSERFLVTGGAGFIGSAFVRRAVREGHRVLNLDKLTYAGSLLSVAEVSDSPTYEHVRGDIGDRALVRALLARFRPTAIVHLAAESHVDRSIDAPAAFIETNVVGTFALLAEALDHWRALADDERTRFRFLHVSTDEVFGTLGATGRFDERSPYQPNSPYSASKAAADHLARAWFHTYGLPVVTTNCTNNYGPYQFPEKLIPLIILRALAGRPLPVYGTGANVRDWLFVDDHVDALLLAATGGRPGETYGVGGNAERSNLEVVREVCRVLDALVPNRAVPDRASLIEFVVDRPGHDFRYAMDTTKIARELGWQPRESFTSGIERTVAWYLANDAWCRAVQGAGGYAGDRLGHAVTAAATS